MPPDERKGAVLMVTYSELIQLGILIVSIISLVIQVVKKEVIADTLTSTAITSL